ncbi:unnamed protein product [Victoria cruziana]
MLKRRMGTMGSRGRGNTSCWCTGRGMELGAGRRRGPFSRHRVIPSPASTSHLPVLTVPTPTLSRSSFNAYDQPLIIHLLFHLPIDQKVVLVGHSARGLSLTHAIVKKHCRIALPLFSTVGKISKKILSL